MQKANTQEYSLLDYCNVPRPNFISQNKPVIKKVVHKALAKSKSKPQVQVVQRSLFDELTK